METVVISDFGSFIISEPFVVYSSEEWLCDNDGNLVEENAEGVKLHCSDLVFETCTMKYTFEQLYLGYDYYLEIIEDFKILAHTKKDVLVLDLRQLLDFIEPELLGPRKSVIIEKKSQS
ncbi:MAG: hypothetical protein E7544_01870 [Ruminococcaceae bacterium]|nr:hypothetical protein [Oscillospiraceae bacterium]